MPNGDIVSGCSDGVIRVFSASEERWASAQDLKEYEAQVASQTLPSEQVGDVKKSDLPGPEVLSTPGVTWRQSFCIARILTDSSGQKPGQVKMIKRNGIVEAHQVCFGELSRPSNLTTGSVGRLKSPMAKNWGRCRRRWVRKKTIL